jgi:hypothetical protein
MRDRANAEKRKQNSTETAFRHGRLPDTIGSDERGGSRTTINVPAKMFQL